MATLLYPRTISIARPTPPSAVGLTPYQGVSESTETTIASGLPANVEVAAAGRNSRNNELPSDAPGPVKWVITLSASAVAGLLLIMERDVIYDDLGRRFQVGAYEPTPLGARIDVVRLLA